MAKKILVSYDFTNLEILNFKFQNLATDPALVAGKPYYNTATGKVMFGNATVYYDPTDRTQHTGAQAISTVTGLQTALDAKATPADVTAAIAAVVGAAPAALDTLVEIATALQADETALAGLITTVGTKADAAATTAALALKADDAATTAALAGKAAVSHAHAIADVTGLQTALDAKALATDLTTGLAGKADTVHTHVIADTTGLQTALDAKADGAATTAALAGKAPTVHSHAIADVTGLQTALDAKASDSATTAALALKADASAVTAALALKADITAVPGKYAVTVGGATSFDITHGLGTLDIIVQAYEISSGDTVECDITRTSTTHITAAFAVAPAAASIRIVVHG